MEESQSLDESDDCNTRITIEDEESREESRLSALQRELDEIDLVLSKRVKKISIPIPPCANLTNSSCRSVFLSDSDYQHLIDEIRGGKYGEPARPDIEMHVVGVGAKKQKSKVNKKVVNPGMRDETMGLGVEILFDGAAQKFIFSRFVEDLLLLLIKNDPSKAQVIDSCCTRNGLNSVYYVDSSKQRLWRRFIRTELEPMLSNKARMDLVNDRYTQRKQSVEENRGESYAATRARSSSSMDAQDSDDDEDEEGKPRASKHLHRTPKGKNRKGKGGSSAAASASPLKHRGKELSSSALDRDRGGGGGGDNGNSADMPSVRPRTGSSMTASNLMPAPPLGATAGVPSSSRLLSGTASADVSTPSSPGISRAPSRRAMVVNSKQGEDLKAATIRTNSGIRP